MHRPFQFDLRTLFQITLGVALAFGLVAICGADAVLLGAAMASCAALLFVLARTFLLVLASKGFRRVMFGAVMAIGLAYVAAEVRDDCLGGMQIGEASHLPISDEAGKVSEAGGFPAELALGSTAVALIFATVPVALWFTGRER